MRQAVLATLIYYNLLDFPLKAEEVFNYLIKTAVRITLTDDTTPLNVRRELDQLVLERIVGFDEGYYFLSERAYLVPLRRKRAALAQRKLRHARRIVWWLRFFPYIEAVLASGSLGLGSCDELSDLDVLIITKHGRIWLTRFLITVWLSLFNLRRKPWQKVAPDKICLNHYITDQSLTIPFQSLYTAQTYTNLKPLFVKNLHSLADFQKNNNWLGQWLYNPWQVEIDPKLTLRPNRWFTWVAAAREFVLNNFFGDWLERCARRYQIRRIARNPLTTHSTSRIVYNDDRLAFHLDSPEKKVLEKYQLDRLFYLSKM